MTMDRAGVKPPLKQGNSSSTAFPTCSVWTDATEPINVQICNKTNCPVHVCWLNYDGEPVQYSTVLPEGTYPMSSYNTHPWCFKYSDGHTATYMGGSAVLELLPQGQLVIKPYADVEDDTSWQDPAWGSYEQRGSVLSIPIMAYSCVCQEAVQRAEHVVCRMMADCSADIVNRMVAAGCKIAIIGKHQVTTDIPAHHFMQARSRCEGERDIDGSTRGLGATPAVPTTSCGEENLTMVDDSRYACENILIHEFGHAVMNLGLDEQQLQRVHQCFKAATTQRLYDPGCYLMENADEYWAEGCQSWFDATVRCDVNSGINTREKMKQHDPEFARLLTEVFGDGPWRYPLTAPACFHGQQAQTFTPLNKQQQQSSHRRRHQPQDQQQQQAATGLNGGAAADVPLHRPITRSLAQAAAAARAALLPANDPSAGSKQRGCSSAATRKGARHTTLSTRHAQQPTQPQKQQQKQNQQERQRQQRQSPGGAASTAGCTHSTSPHVRIHKRRRP